MGSYISEMSPKKYRGQFTSLIGPVYGVFLVIQSSSNCGFSRFCVGWRISHVVQIIGGVAYGVLMLFVPKTPR